MVNSTVIDWSALVSALENHSGRKYKDVAYRFSGNREFVRNEEVYGAITEGFPFTFHPDGYYNETPDGQPDGFKLG
jgi:hypothetical protein